MISVRSTTFYFHVDLGGTLIYVSDSVHESCRRKPVGENRGLHNVYHVASAGMSVARP